MTVLGGVECGICGVGLRKGKGSEVLTLVICLVCAGVACCVVCVRVF